MLQVIAPPVMIGSDDHAPIEVIEGDAVTLECPVSTPINIMDIEWFKNGRPIMVFTQIFFLKASHHFI